ncbi:hypothetical protein HDV05_004017 [Chytridiales sp. JEL 0842]|nr:hypothetical protein HDV05_004017 [Chytridiales sp. JEL 0842]
MAPHHFCNSNLREGGKATTRPKSSSFLDLWSRNLHNLLYPTKTNPNTCGYFLNPPRIGPWESSDPMPMSVTQNGTIYASSSEALKVQYPRLEQQRQVKLKFQLVVPTNDNAGESFDPEIKASVSVVFEPSIKYEGEFYFECRLPVGGDGAVAKAGLTTEVECNKEIEFESYEYGVIFICTELSTAKTFKTPVE